MRRWSACVLGINTTNLLSFLSAISAGVVGLCLTYAKMLTGMFQWCVRQSAEVENLVGFIDKLSVFIDKLRLFIDKLRVFIVSSAFVEGVFGDLLLSFSIGIIVGSSVRAEDKKCGGN